MALEYSTYFKDPDRFDLLVNTLRNTLDPSTMRRLPDVIAGHRGRSAPLPPVHLLWSTQDALIPPSYGDRYKELLPEAQLSWIADSSHFVQVDSPDETVALLLRFDEGPDPA